MKGKLIVIGGREDKGDDCTEGEYASGILSRLLKRIENHTMAIC